MSTREHVESGYERRIRLASEVATWGIAGLLVGSAALPTTGPIARVGLLFSAALLGVFAILWFHAIPKAIFGRLRFTIGTSITQVIGAVLLVLTGGAASPYFVFFLFPTLATTFAMRISSTIVVGAIGLVLYVTILISDGLLSRGNTSLWGLGAISLSAFVALVAMTTLITRTMQETRAALRQRSNELGLQNEELEISRSTALAIARARDLGELLRAVHESARSALGIDRVFFFSGPEADQTGYTIGVDGTIEPFVADRRRRDSPRQRAMRTRRSVIVKDIATETMVNPLLRGQYHVGAGLFVPLIHRGELIGQLVLSTAAPRDWTGREVRLGEVLAESAAPAIASYLALEEVRRERETLAGRMKVLEGMNQLVEALSLAGDEASTAQVAARSVAQGFRLLAATTLFVDPSLALLEPAGTAGAATAHPVVSGPTSCPAIRSGRVFQVASASDPVVCPHMPFAEGSQGYVCAPLMAGGEPMGALFLQPTVGSVVEDTFIRAAADRVALALANRRVLETAQRQAVTDGLTGLFNRHFLQEQLRVVQSLATRHGRPYAVVALDVDGLKQVNDTFGHEMGDLALRGFANTLKRTLRTSDVSFRTGGDEFLVLVPHGDLNEARIAAERVRDAVEAQGRAEPQTAITVSAGVAAWRPGRTAEQVLEVADAMLYAAKRAGKDRVLVEAPAPIAGSAPGAS
ncbi:MAG TPA: diguanylate cyclase [Candidatus Limnocylindria bacterium]|nr:diguanylate cyclase [Candidatus Limnocylindria bacterium]